MRVLKKMKGLYVFLAVVLIAVVSISAFVGVKAIRFQKEMNELKQMDWVIPLGKYDSTAVIEGADGLYAVEKNKKWGIVNRDGNIVLPLKYDWIMEHCDSGLIPVSRQGLCGYANEQGKISIDLQYEYIYPFQEGYASVEKYGQKKIIDTRGHERYSSKFENGELLTTKKAGFAIRQVQDEDNEDLQLTEIIDVKKGKAVFSSDQYSNCQEYSEGLWCFNRLDGSGSDFLDNQFQLAFKKGSEGDVQTFREGLAAYTDYSSVEYLNKKGEAVIKMNGSQCYSFSEGIACVLTQKGGTFIDQKGKILFSVPCYKNIASFSAFGEPLYQGGLCLWQGKNGKYGYLDKSGKYAIKPFLDKAGMAEHGEMAVVYGSEAGVLKLSAQ